MKKLLSFLFVLLFSNQSLANVVGVDTQNFNPTSNGIDFVTVQSSETLEPGIMNFGLFFNYAINTLPNYQNTTTQTRDEPTDQLLSMDLSFGLGLMKNWDIGISFPQVLMQNVDETSTVFRGQFENTGMTEIRLNTKYRFFGDSKGGLATILSMNYYMIENFPFTGTDPGPTINVEMAYDFTVGEVNIGTNVGYRFRNPGDRIPGIPVEPSPDEVILSVASSYLVSRIDTKFIAEVFGSIPTEEVQFQSDRDLSSAEFLFGAKWDVTRDVAMHLGAGTELYQGSASPDWRVYTGINWTIGPFFGKQYEGNPSLTFLDGFDFSRKPEKKEVFISNVHFDFNKSNVSQDFKQTLGQLVEYLNKDGGFKTLDIVGHTDSVGSQSYNETLSVKRALSVRREIVALMPEDQHMKIKAIGKGELEPIADNGNYQGRALNRRVEFIINR